MIAREVIDAYTRKLNGLSASAKRIVAQSLANIEFDSVADLREKLTEILEPIYGVSTDMAAAYAADFYDEIREQSVGERLGASADSGRKPEATEGFIRAFVDGVASKGIVESLALFTDRADYEIKRAAGDCVYLNGEFDPFDVRFARVPSGFETCPFCIMLASRGFVYRNKTSAGADGHYHAHCDCRIVPSFSAEKIEGYDPDALYRQFRDDLEAGKLKLNTKRKPTLINSESVARQRIHEASTVEELQAVHEQIVASKNKLDPGKYPGIILAVLDRRDQLSL